MAKFKCSNCGQAFDGDIATMQCPHCGSYEFKKIGGSILVALFTGEDKPVVSLQEKGQTLVIEVKNVKAPKLRNEYKMVVYDETNSIHQILRFNGKTSVIHYDVAYLLSGKCYNFSLERQDNKRIEELTWTTNRQYCVPLPPVPPVIKRVTGNPIEFTDGADAPLVKCVTQITGYQEGTGTPSPENVRPIHAYTENTISVGRGERTSLKTRSVPCPTPVLLKEPYRITRKASAWGFSLRNRLAARSGPIVWEEEGPIPIL